MTFFPDPDVVDYSEYGFTPGSASQTSDVVPGAVRESLLLARSAEAAVFLTALRAYPNGVAMRLEVCTPPGSKPPVGDVYGDDPIPGQPGSGRLMWGFEFPNGDRASNVHRRPVPGGRGPLLIACGGMSGERTVEIDYWLSPLPDAGMMTIACQWMDKNIPLMTQTHDASLFTSAAANAVALWD